MTKSNFARNWAIAPGEIIEEYRETANMTQAELADRLGYSLKHVNRVIGGHECLTSELALRLESIFGSPAHVWLNLEAAYREHLARVDEQQSLNDELYLLKEIPHRSMVREGYLDDAKGTEMVRALRSFFRVSSLANLTETWGTLHASYRKSKTFKSQQFAVLAWLAMGDRVAAECKSAPFDKMALLNALDDIKALSCLPGVEFEQPLVESLGKHGVILIFVPAPKGASVSGATRWINKDTALVQLSLRHKSDDQLWFTLFHELGHILLHGKRAQFVDFAERDSDLREDEADNFASNRLIGASALCEFVAAGKFSRDAVTAFASAQNISPGIVVGRLQHDGLIPYGTSLNALKKKIGFAQRTQLSGEGV